MLGMIILFGIGLVLAGFFFHKKHKDLERTCTVETRGEVIRVECREEIYTEREEDGRETRRRSVVYYPVFQYRAEGRDIQKVSSTGSGIPSFSAGQEVTVRYDPAAPERFYVVEDKTLAWFGVLLMVLGAVVFILGIVTLLGYN